MDISSLHNPYDFANPVAEQDLFFGRKNQLDEITYYLEHAKNAPRPINIALLGARASGKTSLLNICELEAKKRGFCVVRVDLDENDANTEIAFFYKLFDAIFTKACNHGAFGGTDGKTYDTYLDVMNAYEVPQDKTFCPFLFPIQYAKAMGSGRDKVHLSDNNFKADLQKINTETNCPLIILFDECNVLAKSRVHLEKLRNIFMNLSGYMLVVTGTPDLFPVIDDVFSPIIRQFKKISVEGFTNIDETESCIKKPLEKLNIKPDKILNFGSTKEIHDLSGGRPYEIQLICHKLFRRIQNRRAKIMKLDLSILEDIRRELETSQDMSSRPIISKIQNLTIREFNALNLLCSCDNLASFDQIWSIEYTVRGISKWTKEVLDREYHHLIEKGIISVLDQIIKFEGDDFDKIYTKYFAREKGIPLGFQDRTIVTFVFMRVAAFFRNKIDDLNFLLNVQKVDTDDLSNSMIKFANSDPEADDFLVEDMLFSEDIYSLMFKYRNYKSVQLVKIKLNFPWVALVLWFYSDTPDNQKPLEDCLSRAEIMNKRIREVGGNLEVVKEEYPIIPLEKLASKIENTDNDLVKEMIAAFHLRNMHAAYLESNKQESLLNAELAYQYNKDWNLQHANNIGYVFLSNDKNDIAKELFTKAIQSTKENTLWRALSLYNLGILEAKSKNIPLALENITQCIANLNSLSQEEGRCACLISPEVMQGELVFVENNNKPNLIEIAQNAIETLESLGT